MCVALLSWAHPNYPFILLDNRDEYLNRPTAEAEWWSKPHSDVLGGRDLLRDVQGTWLGITRTGKVAVLTNFREDETPPPGAVSRGAIIRKFLTKESVSTEAFVKGVVDTGIAKDAGGFSLVCGRVGEKLAVVSNRAEDRSQVPWIGETGQTVGLSNTAFSDHTWPKVEDGMSLMKQAISKSVESNDTEDQLVQRFLTLLSRDTLPRHTADLSDGLEAHVRELRKTIFVPPIGRKDLSGMPGDEIARARKSEKAEILEKDALQKQPQLGVSGLYGTQKQTVILVNKDLGVRFIERTLYDNHSNPIPTGEGDVDLTFKIDTR